MNDLVEAFVTEHFFNLACMQSFDLIQLLRAVVNQTARKFLALKIETAHAFPDAKRSAYFFEARREQTLSLAHQRLSGALIDDNLAHRFEVVRDPMLAMSQAI